MTTMSTVYDANAKIWQGWQRDEEPLDENVSVGEWALRMMRNKSSNEICQISDPDNANLTYHEALAQAIQLAKQMRKWQLTCYDIIGVVATNSKYLMQIILAAWFNGLAFHAINPEEKVEAIHYLLNKTKPKIIFCDGLYLDKLQNTLHSLYPIVCTMCNHVDNNLDAISIEQLLKTEEESEDLFGLLSEKSLTVFSFCNIDWIFGFYGLLSSILYGNLRIITSQPYTPEYMTHIICRYKVNCLLATSNQISQCINFHLNCYNP